MQPHATLRGFLEGSLTAGASWEGSWKAPVGVLIGNGRNAVSRVLFRRRELTEPHLVLGQTR